MEYKELFTSGSNHIYKIIDSDNLFRLEEVQSDSVEETLIYGVWQGSTLSS